MTESSKLQSLVEAFPNLYPHRFQFRAFDGWYDLLNRLSQVLGEEPVYARQVKEKFGTLRFYISGHPSPTASLAIKTAKEESARTCEWCGGPGVLRVNERGWFRTSCEVHAEGSVPVPTPDLREDREDGDSYMVDDPAT